MSFERRQSSNRPRLRLRLPSRSAVTGPVARAFGLTAAMFLVGYFIAAEWLFPAAELATDVTFVEVPDLEGLPLADSRSRLGEAGLAARVVTEIHHQTLLSGTVLAQSPLPGQVALPGDTVRVTLSSGPESRIIPDLAGLAGPEAARLLRGLGFEVEIIAQREPTGRAGAIETRPPAGARVYMPAQVELVVGEGAPILDVPDLLGRHMDDLAEILQLAQLQLGAIRFQIDADEAPGRVVSQSPGAASVLRGGGFVSVVIAGTPPDSMAADLAGEDVPSRSDTLSTTPND